MKEEEMDEVEIVELLSGLETNLNAGLVSYPIPSSEDEDFVRLINYFQLLPMSLRSDFLTYFNTRKWSSMLGGFSVRMAIHAVRENSSEDIFNGLMAHVIEDFWEDWRENYIDLSLLSHSSRKINANFESLIDRAILFATHNASEYLIGFSTKSPGVSSIEVMGYQETIAKDGFSYKFVGVPLLKPRTS